MTGQSFAATYRLFTNLQLYEVLQNQQDYQPAAIEAALAEWNDRQLGEEEIEKVINEWEQSRQPLERKKEKQRALESKIKTYRDKVVDEFDPLVPPSAERTIRMICIISGFILLYSLLRNYKILVWRLSDPSPLELLSLFDYYPLLIVPIGIWKFWNKKKSGWAILCGWMAYMIPVVVFSLVNMLRYTSTGTDTDNLFYPTRNILPYIVALLSYGGLLFAINGLRVRTAFAITKHFRENTILIAGLFSAVVITVVIYA